jgi:hypothetical protein
MNEISKVIFEGTTLVSTILSNLISTRRVNSILKAIKC